MYIIGKLEMNVSEGIKVKKMKLTKVIASSLAVAAMFTIYPIRQMHNGSKIQTVGGIQKEIHGR